MDIIQSIKLFPKYPTNNSKINKKNKNETQQSIIQSTAKVTRSPK
jgi:hypothetical protein